MTEPNRQSGENEERIIEIEIERLRPFKEHPFQVKDDKEMFLLQESIEKYGILNPLISLMKTEGRMQNLWRMPFIIRKILIRIYMSRKRKKIRLPYRRE